mgnify:FL=1
MLGKMPRTEKLTEKVENLASRVVSQDSPGSDAS